MPLVAKNLLLNSQPPRFSPMGVSRHIIILYFTISMVHFNLIFVKGVRFLYYSVLSIHFYIFHIMYDIFLFVLHLIFSMRCYYFKAEKI